MKSSAANPPLFFLRLFRPTVPKGHELTLARQRIYVLPTPQGLLFAAMLGVMLLGAINYNNSLGFMLTFLLAALGLVSILYTYRNIAALKVCSGKAMPVFAGGTARFLIHLHNPDALPRYGLRVKAADAAATADVAPLDGTVVALERPARHRGRLSLGRVTLSTTYPLGLVRAWAYVDPDMHCVVYPRPGPYRALAEAHPPQRGERPGTTAGGDDFAGFRAYRAGDTLRHVHWKAVARAQPLMTKQFTAGEGPDLWLDWAALPCLDTETRLRRLCRWVLEADRGTCAYGLRIPGCEITPGQGPLHRHRCLEALARYREPRQ